MRNILSLWICHWHRLIADRRGNVAIIFGLCLLPMLGLAGIAIDYSAAAAAQARLNSVADSAALAAVSVAGNPSLTTPSQAQAQGMFQTAVTTMPNVTLGTVTLTPNLGVTALAVTVNYTATVQTTMSNIIGISSMTISGSSSASRNLPSYVDFYLLLDNSPSMGLGATAADISLMQSVTPGPSNGTCYQTTSGASCAFACHQHTFNSKNEITGDDTTDCYSIAKNNNVTTRIDVLRQATQALTVSATSAETVSNQFRMGVYTFSDQFQTVSNLTSSLSTVATQTSAVDLAYAYQDQRDSQTSYDTAMQQINSIMPDPGSGTSSTAPEKFLFLVTDGVEDAPVKSASGSGDTQDPVSPSTTGPTSTNLANTLTGNDSSTRLITYMNTSLCTTIKNRGIKIAVLYTTYEPVTSNAFYNSWVAPITTSTTNIASQLEACASPGFYFPVSPTDGITEAMQKMFFAALQEARLTH
jgi:Flp pilus assembly protein TadG